MLKAIARPLLALFVLLGSATAAHADVPQDFTAFKTAATELKTLMQAITTETTATTNEVKLEAAVIKYNETGATLDASLAKLDRSQQASGQLYADTLTQIQAASQEVSTENLRLMSNPAISAVVTLAISKLNR